LRRGSHKTLHGRPTAAGVAGLPRTRALALSIATNQPVARYDDRYRTLPLPQANSENIVQCTGWFPADPSASTRMPQRPQGAPRWLAGPRWRLPRGAASL